VLAPERHAADALDAVAYLAIDNDPDPLGLPQDRVEPRVVAMHVHVEPTVPEQHTVRAPDVGLREQALRRPRRGERMERRVDVTGRAELTVLAERVGGAAR